MWPRTYNFSQVNIRQTRADVNLGNQIDLALRRGLLLYCGTMDATLREPDTHRDADLHALVAEMREEISRLRREVSELRCEAGYWKSRHADAVERNKKLQEELDQARAEIRKLKADLFGRKSEKQSSSDRSNHLDDPQDPNAAQKRKRGQQPDRPAPRTAITPIFRCVKNSSTCRPKSVFVVVAGSLSPTWARRKIPSQWKSSSPSIVVGFVAEDIGRPATVLVRQRAPRRSHRS